MAINDPQSFSCSQYLVYLSNAVYYVIYITDWHSYLWFLKNKDPKSEYWDHTKQYLVPTRVNGHFVSWSRGLNPQSWFLSGSKSPYTFLQSLSICSDRGEFLPSMVKRYDLGKLGIKKFVHEFCKFQFVNAVEFLVFFVKVSNMWKFLFISRTPQPWKTSISNRAIPDRPISVAQKHYF